MLLLEAGKSDNYLWVKLPIGYKFCYENPRVNWCYRTQKEKYLNDREEDYPRGRVLGGCSSINGMIYNRAQKQDYDNWANLTNDATWKWEHVLPLFKKFEHYYGGDNEWHSTKGELWVEPATASKYFPFFDAFCDAAVQSGIPYTTDFNRGDNIGVGYNDVNMKKGFRFNAAEAFIHPIAKERADILHIKTQCHVKELIF